MNDATRHLRAMVVACICGAATLLPPVLPALGQQADGSSRGNAILEFPNLGPIPGGSEPAMGSGPGALEAGMDAPNVGVLGGRRRNARVPRQGKTSRTGLTAATSRAGAMSLPEPLPQPTKAPRGTVPPIGPLDAALIDDEGPANGLTLDAAIERMMAANLDIQALRHELPQADADILTAGLRTNPLIYMDTQFIPYGSFTDARPGGPTQYDLNITYPVDVSHKRQSRTVVARMARTALEAQFQDVVRRQISNVGMAFVGLQAAKLGLVAAEAAVRRHETQLAEARRNVRPNAPESADLVEHEAFLVEQSKLALIDATEAFADAQESLAVLLNEPPETTDQLHPKGNLRNTVAAPPPVEELTNIALKCRPDIRSLRAGVSRANAEVALQRANRFDDIYLFYDPITIQDNRPIHAPNSNSWAVGVTFALPIYNRNQGNIARAISNVQQTRQELSSVERRVTSEVRLAEREFQTSKRALEQIEKTLLPQVQSSIRRRAEQFANGDISLEDFQSHLEEAAEVAQSRREALIRHRRSMLDLNTAVGLRLLP